jgi:hypothetical protein
MADLSVFSRAFSYRQRENMSPFENYLTEIFAFCIEKDLKFRNDLFKNRLGINIGNSDYSISTQIHYDTLGRPDIEFCFNDTAIIFECKVEAGERMGQLSDYTSILCTRKTQKKKHLVFLTKYFEHRDDFDSRINPHFIRWFEIYELINPSHDEITNQLKLFLKENNMEKTRNFSIQDTLSLKTIPETLSKMEEVLEQLRPEFVKNFGGYSREKNLQYSYNGWGKLKCKSSYLDIVVGFRWDWEEFEIPFWGLWINIPKKLIEADVITPIKKELVGKGGWESTSNDTVYCIMEPLTSFIDKNEDSIPAMKKFILDKLLAVYSMKKKYSQIFK